MQPFLQSGVITVRSGAAATTSVALLQDDALLREDLCAFFNLTGGRSWQRRAHWCAPDVSICDWGGLKCDANQTVVIQFSMRSNNLRLADPDGDINFVWRHLTDLQQLDLSANGFLGSLDLTPLIHLQSLSLTQWNDLGGSVLPWSTLIMPADPPLIVVDISYCGLWFDLRRTPRLQRLNAMGNYAPFQLAQLWHAPDILRVSFVDSMLNSDQSAPDGSGLSGGALTHFVFSNLNRTNPLLSVLDLSGAPLTFGEPDASGSNWPTIVAPSLTDLVFNRMAQLRTGPTGADSAWLIGLPALRLWSLNDLPNAAIHTAAFNGTGSGLEDVDLRSTRVVGDLQPLYKMRQLTSLIVTNSGLRSALPANVSAVWPLLEKFRVSNCHLYGPLPSFANLPALSAVDLGNNELSGELPADLFVGSRRLFSLDLSFKYDRQSQLQVHTQRLRAGSCVPRRESCGLSTPNVCVCVCVCVFSSLSGPLPSVSLPSLNYLVLNNNRFTGPLPLWNAPQLLHLNLANTPLYSHIPADWWGRMPKLAQLDLSDCGLIGPISDAPELRSFTNFILASNQLTGSLPANISATFFSVANNRLSGAVSVPDGAFPMEVRSLLLSHNDFSCPIRLAHLTTLEQLSLQNGGFKGCNFNDPALVQLPDTLITLDVSGRTATRPAA